MSALIIDGTDLVLHLSAGEKVAALRGDLRVPLTAVAAVEVAPDGLAAVHGLRSPGLQLPGRRKIGTWRGKGRRELVSVTRSQPAVRVALRGHKLTALVVSTSEAEALAAQIRQAVS